MNGSGWNQVIRTGDPEADRRMLETARAQAAGQGMMLDVRPLAEGGFQVTAMAPYAPPATALAPAYPAQVAHVGQNPGCQVCGRHAPTKHVTFMQNVGAIVIRFPRTIRGYLCRSCIDRYFWKYTLITFFFGWWGVISFFYSLVSIPTNIVQFLSSRKLPPEFGRGTPG